MVICIYNYFILNVGINRAPEGALFCYGLITIVTNEVMGEPTTDVELRIFFNRE